MKYTRKKLVKGDTRICHRFLYLPKTIGDTTYWLCRAKWEQKVEEEMLFEPDGVVCFLAWRDVKWI